MTDELQIERGSGNVFADLGLANADIEQTKALLAAEIIRILDEERLSVHEAEQRSGAPAPELARIRSVDLDAFTIDRLMQILQFFDRSVEVHLCVRRRRPEAA